MKYLPDLHNFIVYLCIHLYPILNLILTTVYYYIHTKIVVAKSLKELEIQKVHAGHFRGQYLDRQGNLLVHDDEDVFLDH
jgi:hypothetical protein